MNFPKFSILNAKVIIAKTILAENCFLETINVLLYCDKIKEKVSVRVKSSSKSKIDLRNKFSVQDKLQNIKKTKLQKFKQNAFHLNVLNQFLCSRSYQTYVQMRSNRLVIGRWAIKQNCSINSQTCFILTQEESS